VKSASHQHRIAPGAAPLRLVAQVNRWLGGLMGAKEMMTRNFNIRKIAYVLLVIALFYLGLGLGFHIKWKSALDTCRAAQMAHGEFVEPEVFENALGMIFDVTYWPVYLRANIYHFGTPFATPCSHS
jgi:hypothetical protein